MSNYLKITPAEGEVALLSLFMMDEHDLLYLHPKINRAKRSLYTKLQHWDALSEELEKEGEEHR